MSTAWWTEACVWTTCLGSLHDSRMVADWASDLYFASPTAYVLRYHATSFYLELKIVHKTVTTDIWYSLPAVLWLRHSIPTCKRHSKISVQSYLSRLYCQQRLGISRPMAQYKPSLISLGHIARTQHIDVAYCYRCRT